MARCIVDPGMLDGALVIGQSNQMEAIERVAERYLPMVVWGSTRWADPLHRGHRQSPGRPPRGAAPA
jgi:hypothetical protein